MQLGKVIENVVSTQKNTMLRGCKLFVVRLIHNRKLSDKYVVAVDSIGAGEGETVILTFGSSARIGIGKESAPIDAAIVGIVDDPGSVWDGGEE